VGIAYSREGHEDVESLLRDADLAMYRAKDAGKNGYIVASGRLIPSEPDLVEQPETVDSS